MNFLTDTKHRHTLITILGAILLQYVFLFEAHTFFQSMLFALCFCIGIGILGFRYGAWIYGKQGRSSQVFFGTILLVSGITSILAVVYWFFQINTQIISIVVALFSLTALFLPYTQHKREKISFHINKLSVMALGIFGLQLLLLYKVCSKRLGDTIISPWTFVGPLFFITFFVMIAGLFWLLQQKKLDKKIGIMLIVGQYVLMLSVALIMYKHGFGFDPFIHQATEEWILQNGFITPKVPYYIGQYMLVIFLSLGGTIPTLSIDQALVPLLAGILIPLWCFFTFQKKLSLFALALLPLLPLSFFIVTTPNNLALLISLLIAFSIYTEFEEKTPVFHRSRILPLVLVLTAASIHPFVGIPLGIIYTGSIVLQHQTYRVLPYVYALILTLALPLLFFVYLGGVETLANPLHSLWVFASLFQAPHWYMGKSPSLAWELLYAYKQWIVPLVCMVSIAGMSLVHKKTPLFVRFSLITAGALCVSSLLVATAIVPPNIISYERGNYAHRLLLLALIFLLPFVYHAYTHLAAKATTNKRRMLIAIFGSGLMLVSWYFTYPTRDPVSLYTGYSVRDADIEAIEFIHERNNFEPNYIVLSNQVIGAAALQTLGFLPYHRLADGSEHYLYSIPTGGILYEYFRKMIYEYPKREWMEQAMDVAGVDTAYFIHTNYWAPAGIIRDAAKKEADTWWDIGEGRVWVYEYTREKLKSEKSKQ
ncbi:MAG: hypothetical protein KBD15_01510 [Candidatus Magasanikbacteria bacterium]|nr:hypothetical protein [Candidatus Magasanikbacteria bacterium]